MSKRSASASPTQGKPKQAPAGKAQSTAKAGQSKSQPSASSKKTERNKEFDDFFKETAAGSAPASTATAKAAGTPTAKSEKSGKQAAKPKSKPAAAKRKKRKKQDGRLKPLKLLFRAALLAACAVLIWCLYAYYVIIFHEQQPLQKADAGIILGAALWNEQPSPALKERLDYAIELYEEGLVDYLILSGGKPNYSRGLSEAEGMQRYLADAGIPHDKLLLETQSRDTYENVEFSKRVAEKHGLSSLMIISHQYHTKRAEDIAAYVGLKHVQTAGTDTKVLNESYHYTREMLAYTKWQLNKLLMPLGLMI